MLIISFSINPSSTPPPSCCINKGGGATINTAGLWRPFTCTEIILMIQHQSEAFTQQESRIDIKCYYVLCLLLRLLVLSAAQHILTPRFRPNGAMMKMLESTEKTREVSFRLLGNLANFPFSWYYFESRLSTLNPSLCHFQCLLSIFLITNCVILNPSLFILYVFLFLFLNVPSNPFSHVNPLSCHFESFLFHFKSLLLHLNTYPFPFLNLPYSHLES